MNAIRRSYSRLPSWHGGFQRACVPFAIGGRAVALWLLAFLLLTPAVFAATKTLSGRLREVKDNALTIQQDHLFDSSMIQVEMNDQTKVTGELAQGMHIKVKYREERDGKGSEKATVRRIAMEIQTWPESASKEDRKAEKDAQQ
jgi:hypothetical protein